MRHTPGTTANGAAHGASGRSTARSCCTQMGEAMSTCKAPADIQAGLLSQDQAISQEAACSQARQALGDALQGPPTSSFHACKMWPLCMQTAAVYDCSSTWPVPHTGLLRASAVATDARSAALLYGPLPCTRNLSLPDLTISEGYGLS